MHFKNKFYSSLIFNKYIFYKNKIKNFIKYIKN